MNLQGRADSPAAWDSPQAPGSSGADEPWGEGNVGTGGQRGRRRGRPAVGSSAEAGTHVRSWGGVRRREVRPAWLLQEKDVCTGASGVQGRGRKEQEEGNPPQTHRVPDPGRAATFASAPDDRGGS